MALASIIGKVAGFAGRALGFFRRPKTQAIARQALPVAAGAAAGALLAPRRAGRRRRRGRALTMPEMGTLMVLGQALGRKSPVVTLAAMKALSGRL